MTPSNQLVVVYAKNRADAVYRVWDFLGDAKAVEAVVAESCVWWDEATNTVDHSRRGEPYRVGLPSIIEIGAAAAHGVKLVSAFGPEHVWRIEQFEELKLPPYVPNPHRDAVVAAVEST